jgi:hypothetical protein
MAIGCGAPAATSKGGDEADSGDRTSPLGRPMRSRSPLTETIRSLA